MNLIEQIDYDFKQALKNRDASTIGVLRMLKSALKNKAVEKRADLNDADVVAILKSEAKKRKESIEAFKKGERYDLVRHEEAELGTLQTYLPEQMSVDQVKAKIVDVAKSLPETDRNNFGKLMSAVMQSLAGQSDGQTVGQLVKHYLQTEK